LTASGPILDTPICWAGWACRSEHRDIPILKEAKAEYAKLQ
jgi:hypothetical protein